MESHPYELFRRGTELLAKDHAHQAVTVLERAHRLLPGKGSVSEALGRAYYQSGQPAAARAQFAEVLEIDPTNDYAHFGLALCLARVGEPKLAAGHLRLALAMRPGVAAYEEALARLTAAPPPPDAGAADHRD
jgi:tetratricopeptide (TPR) repeat protein